jgi:rubrerythrin
MLNNGTHAQTELDARDVFEVAMQIEQTGAEFYENYARRSRHAATRELLAELARMERKHEQQFADLRRQIPETPISTTQSAREHLQAAADSHVFSVYDYTDLLTGWENPEEVLRTALAFEKDTVVFFVSMHEMVPESMGRAGVARLVQEELGHVAKLSAHLEDIRQSPRQDNL